MQYAPREMVRSLTCVVLIGFIFSGVVSCASLKSLTRGATSFSKNQDIGRIEQLERELRRKQTLIEDLKERNLVLESRLRPVKRSNGAESEQDSDPVPVPFTPSAAVERNEVINDDSNLNVTQGSIHQSLSTASVRQMAKVEEPVVKLLGEQLLYSKVLETYRRKNPTEMAQAIELLLKTYRDSAFADNSLYLASLLSIETHQSARAFGYLERILRDYPNSNKAVSALFAKAVMLKREGRYSEAERLLNKLRDDFPGSPEAKRAIVELNLIRMAAADGSGSHN